jgi:hypothetical protein
VVKAHLGPLFIGGRRKGGQGANVRVLSVVKEKKDGARCYSISVNALLTPD